MHRLLILLLLLAPPALADHITIGTFTYLGTTAQGSEFQAVFDTNGVTAAPLTFDILIGNQVVGATLGPYTTPLTITFGPGYLGGPVFSPNCPCTFANLTVIPGGYTGFPMTFLLANGQSFVALPTTSSIISPLPGQPYLQPGQSVPIVLTSVPEPATALQFVGGLVGLALQRKYFRTRQPQAS